MTKVEDGEKVADPKKTGPPMLLMAHDDDDDRLDQEELTQVATAVLAELKQLQRRKKRKSASWSRKTGKQTFPSSQLSPEQMVETFVTRCMEFDTDDDNALNAAETKRMATALIRSLS